LKHKKRAQNDTKFLVDKILLSSLDSPDIETIPVTVEQYAVELPKLMHLQFEQISNPQTLDDNQHELMGLHYKMNHLPLPAIITLAEKSHPRSATEGPRHLGPGWAGSTQQDCLPTCCRYFLQGGSTSHPTIWQQKFNPFPDGFGTSWGISHLCRLPDGKDA
jgi:hypothetical protein